MLVAGGWENLYNRASPVENPYNRPLCDGKAAPFGGFATTFPPQLRWWDYGCSAMCHMFLRGSVEQTSPSGVAKELDS